jgi:DHA2 family multidrug resistance protein
MEVLDTTVVNVSLPHIAGSLSSTPEEATWSLTSYLVANAIILPLAGWLAQRIGRRRLLLISVAGFTITSVLCGLATSLGALILFRVLQGLSGGALQPISQAVMLESFPPEKRGRAMGMWALGVVVAPMLGPIFGGWLTETASWHWIFFLNLPVGIASFVAIRALLHDPPDFQRERGRVDGWGLGLLVIGLGSLQILLDKGQQEDWFGSNLIRWLTLFAVVGLVAFIIREWRAEQPVLDLRLLHLRSYGVGVGLIFCVGLVLYGSILLLPLMLQTLLGYSAYDAGLTTAPRGLGSFLAMPVIGLMVGRVGGRRLLFSGLLLCAFTLFWLSRLDLAAGPHDFFWPQILQGISLGLLFVPLNTIAMAAVPRHRMGHATSLFNVMRNIGGSVGIAMSTTLVSRGSQVHTEVLARGIDPYSSTARAWLAQVSHLLQSAGSDATSALMTARAAAWGEVVRQASALAFLDTYRLLAMGVLVLLPLVPFLGRAPRAGGGLGAMH